MSKKEVKTAEAEAEKKGGKSSKRPCGVVGVMTTARL
jgi:hypothetical protein